MPLVDEVLLQAYIEKGLKHRIRVIEGPRISPTVQNRMADNPDSMTRLQRMKRAYESAAIRHD